MFYKIAQKIGQIKLNMGDIRKGDMKRILVITFVLLSVGCAGIQPEPTPTPTPIPTTTSTPTIIPTNTPDPCVILSMDLIEQGEDYVKEWQDAFNLAMSTPKIALAPQIQDLQRIKREYEKILLPDECSDYEIGFYRDIYLSMEEVIAGFTAYLSGEPDAEVQAHFIKATELLSQYE